MFRYITRLLVIPLLMALLIISGCGAKGDLFLPENQQQQTQE
jgi:predicted small lipoprotein YifL